MRSYLNTTDCLAGLADSSQFAPASIRPWRNTTDDFDELRVINFLELVASMRPRPSIAGS
jgi:hypothetical protein